MKKELPPIRAIRGNVIEQEIADAERFIQLNIKHRAAVAAERDRALAEIDTDRRYAEERLRALKERRGN
jgi:hypothetical protein